MNTMNDDKYMGCGCLIIIVLTFLCMVLPIILLLFFGEELFTGAMIESHRLWEIADSVWTK